MKTVLKNNTLYFIDDDFATNFLHERLLDSLKMDYQREMFLDAQSALDKLKSLYRNFGKVPCYIFLDVFMPAMTGFQFLETVEDIFRDVSLEENLTVILLSSSRISYDLEGKQYKNIDIIMVEKPLDSIKLKSLLNQ